GGSRPRCRTTRGTSGATPPRCRCRRRENSGRGGTRRRARSRPGTPPGRPRSRDPPSAAASPAAPSPQRDCTAIGTGSDNRGPVAGEETYERPAIAGSGTIACGLAACASVSAKTLLLARSDASAWKAEEEATKLCAKVDGADGERIKVTTDVSDLAECDLVVEAVIEELEPKVELLKRVAGAAGDADL